MPVARSDPRRATVIGVIGVVVGTVLILVVLFAGNLGDDNGKTVSSKSKFNVGPAREHADAIAKDRTPLIFQDPVEFQQPIVVQHVGEDATKGWSAFSAVVEGTPNCVLTWHVDAQDFTDCQGHHIPANGGAQHEYPTTVDQNGDVVVDLSVNPSASS